MNHDRRSHPTRGIFSLLFRLLVLCCFVVGVIAIVGYFAGWITFTHDEQQHKATIQVDTGEVKQAAKDSVDKGKQLINEAVDEVKKLKKADTGSREGNTREINPVPADDKPSDQSTPSDAR